MMNRREILQGVLAGATMNTSLAAGTPTLGLLAPVESAVPPEAITLYPGVRFLNAGLGLKTMTPDGYDQVLDRIAPKAKELARQGASAITLMGTSLSFYKGAAFNRELTRRIAQASGLPATTMSTAVVEGLRSVGGKRLAVATAYNDEVNRRLHAFLGEEGFEVPVIRGLGVEKVEDIYSVTREALFGFSADVFAAAKGADALLVSCGGLHTLDLLEPLEQRCHVPVVSSLPHALRAGVRLLGLNGRVTGYGTLLST
ncbi:MAG TPA: aspartate/glutamate racemase family protein [Steroidobacteraceae bacterium]|nr:aspartate/glutamate racemase family protein [Steroidobacteraceae bacterium]